MRFITLFILVFVGCATTAPAPRRPGFSDVKVGMKMLQVWSMLGEPSMKSEQDAMDFWVYSDGDYNCGLAFDGGRVSFIKPCQLTEQGRAKVEANLQWSQRERQRQNEEVDQYSARLKGVGDSFGQRQSFGDTYLKSVPAGPSPAAISTCGYAPYPRVGCQNQCMNGHWVEVCP